MSGALERAALGPVARGMTELAGRTAGALARAARHLARTPDPSVVILTGFMIRGVDPPRPETDGPVGTAQLAGALRALGATVRVLTDEPCRHAVRAALDAAGARVPLDVAPGPGATAERWSAWETAALARYAPFTHVVSVERAGPGADGRPRDMHGRDISDLTAPLHRIYGAGSWRRIAVGDGGNEIGMGSLDPVAVARAVRHGPRVHCTVPCDDLILGGTSNWGATALVLALAERCHAPSLLRFARPDLSRVVLDRLAVRGLAVDGVTARRSRSVDGIDWPRYCLQLELMVAATRCRVIPATGPGPGARSAARQPVGAS